jgi:hypothetical protein
VEFGAWDGRYLSNTWDLWRNQGWRAVLIEGDAERFRSLERTALRHSSVTAVHAFVTPRGENSLDQLLGKLGIGEDIDLLSVDIDGDEFYVLEGLERVRPRVIVIEYNPTIPPELSLVQEPGAYFGASARALVELGKRKNYRFVGCTQTNCILVDEADFGKLEITEPDLAHVFPRESLTYVVNAYDGATFVSRVPLFSPPFPPLEAGNLRAELMRVMRGRGSPAAGGPPTDTLKPVRIFAVPGESIRRSLWRRAAAWFWRKLTTGPRTHRLRQAINRRAQQREDQEILQKWIESGRPVPPPHQLKRQVLDEYARRYGVRVLVETGTYEGEMVEAMRPRFDRVFSIELSPEHFKRAAEHFMKYENVQIVFGDSALVLPDVLADIAEPTLFWLDGHFSQGNTAKGAKETPILSEIDAICRHSVNGHVVLVDDARCFNGTSDYPTLAELEAYVRARRPGASFEVRDDIIRIT